MTTFEIPEKDMTDIGTVNNTYDNNISVDFGWFAEYNPQCITLPDDPALIAKFRELCSPTPTPMHNFKVGDKIRPNSLGMQSLAVSPRICLGGGHCVVTGVSSPSLCYDIIDDNGVAKQRAANSSQEYFELISSPTSPMGACTPEKSLAELAKENALTPEERELRKYGLKDNTGEWTSAARNAADEILLQEKKGQILDLAKAREAAAKECNKADKC